jgi:hypothetical protein
MKAAVLLGLVGSTLAAWSPDRYIISFWVDPLVDPSEFQAE